MDFKSIGDFAKLLLSIDTSEIRKRLPSPATQEQFEAAKMEAGAVLNLARAGQVNPELISRMEAVCGEFRRLHAIVRSDTEIGTKARLNEAVLAAETGFYERSIFLAGIAKCTDLAEPYKTQILTLPAHACLARFRQMRALRQILRADGDGRKKGSARLMGLVRGIERSYVDQMAYFAGDCFTDRPDHPLASYHRAVAMLLLASRACGDGDERSADSLVDAANASFDRIKPPESGTHYMHVNVHKSNNAEFSELASCFSPLPKEKLERVALTLSSLARQAGAIDGGGFVPPMSFELMPYVGIARRAASVVAIITLAGALTGIGSDQTKAACNGVWRESTEGVLKESTAVAMANTGGLGRLGGHERLIEVAMSNTGGLGMSEDTLDDEDLGDALIRTHMSLA